MSTSAELALAQRFADIGDRLGADVEVADGNRVLDDLAVMAVEMVDGAEEAGVTVGRSPGGFQTVAASSPLVHAVDQIQYDLLSGPCVDAAVEQTVFNVTDLRSDRRWPRFGSRAAAETGVVSMLSMRLFVEVDNELIAGLNMYSTHPSAFDSTSEATALLLATHGAMAVGRATAQAKARNLSRALETSREIGTAMGILMALHKLTREQAFDLLRLASQQTHRKVADLAVDVVETGALPVPFRRSPG